jgi:hypothetical protein
MAASESTQEPSNKRPRETHFWDTADSFTSSLRGHVYRMYASSPDFKGPMACCEYGEGVSMILLADGSGYLVVSSRGSGSDGVRHATIPLKLADAEQSAQKYIRRIELNQFKDRCMLLGESGPSSTACEILNDFACEILEVDGSDWQLKLYPSLGGHSFYYGGEEDGEEQTTLATDLVMTTPNCDELGHYLFRKTGATVASDTLDAAVASEVAVWDAILSGPELAVGDKVRISHAFESASEGGGKLNTGLIGTVKQVDEDGDAEVDFGSDRGEHWIFARNFRNLSKELP